MAVTEICHVMSKAFLAVLQTPLYSKLGSFFYQKCGGKIGIFMQFDFFAKKFYFYFKNPTLKNKIPF